MTAPQDFDVDRYAQAMATSAGYGQGASDAITAADLWPTDSTRAVEHANPVIADARVAYRYAHERVPTIDEYLDGGYAGELGPRDQLTDGQRAALECAYRSGYDVGYVAKLLTEAVAIRERYGA